MKKSAVYTATFLFMISLFLLPGWMPAQAQGVNLLANPGFENPYMTVSGDPPRQVAQGWTPWHVARTSNMPSFQNTQPEYAPAAPDNTRIRSGNNAQLYSSFFATHDGGVFQRITGITPGTELRFGVYAYVWSTTFDDRSRSEEDGDVILRVGIDPSGGTDGTSSTIIWSTPIEQYDAYREYSIIATASASAVTVFVRSTIGFPVQNSYIYLDDAVLAPTTDTSVPPPASSTPTNTSVPPSVTPTNTSVPPTNTPMPAATTDDAGIITPTELSTFTPAPTNTFTVMPPTETPTLTPTTAEATPTPEGRVPTATPIAVGGVATPISETFPSTIIHTVRSGDTVGQLAVQYNSTVEAIIAANGLDSNALIHVGQGLIIPVRQGSPATQFPTPFPTFTREVPITPTPVIGGTGGPNIANLYIVQRGDTLSAISKRFNTTIAALAQLNGIVNPDRIAVGQSILVPVPGTGGPSGSAIPTSPPVVVPPLATPTPVVVAPPPAPVQRVYVVQPGDNLYRISLRFNVPLQRLGAANGIVNYNLIYVGQVLTIPL